MAPVRFQVIETSVIAIIEIVTSVTAQLASATSVPSFNCESTLQAIQCAHLTRTGYSSYLNDKVYVSYLVAFLVTSDSDILVVVCFYMLSLSGVETTFPYKILRCGIPSANGVEKRMSGGYTALGFAAVVDITLTIAIKFDECPTMVACIRYQSYFVPFLLEGLVTGALLRTLVRHFIVERCIRYATFRA